MQSKLFKSAPLPFLGQKRRFVSQVKELAIKYPQNTIFIDLFGGSGLLSHTIKRQLPNARVIYNDYDNYSQRITQIDTTNELLSVIRDFTANLPIDKKIPEPIKREILEVIKKFEVEGKYVDYITLSSNLLFSMKYVSNYEDLTKQTFYNCVRTSNYNATGYLDGLEVVSVDYKELYSNFKDISNVVYLVDPPYLSTDVSAYKENYWGMKDYLDVLNVIQKGKFIYFTSNKSQIIELCSWIGANPNFKNPFEKANISTTSNQVNWTASYTDMMLYN